MPEIKDNFNKTYDNIRSILLEARTKVTHAVNFAMVQAGVLGRKSLRRSSMVKNMLNTAKH
ncbi:hypothetical protein KJ762_06065 [bacterium]|nr:hypothetical protein [bacterium]